VRARDYVEIQQSWDSTDPRTDAAYLKSGFINDLPDSLINEIVEGFEPQDGRAISVHFQQSGGAIGRVSADATAFVHRNSKANMLLNVSWPNESDADPHVGYIRRYWDALAPYTDGYYTVASSDESDQIRHSNYQGNFPRLQKIKEHYDPTNLFRLNPNVRLSG